MFPVDKFSFLVWKGTFDKVFLVKCPCSKPGIFQAVTLSWKICKQNWDKQHWDVREGTTETTVWGWLLGCSKKLVLSGIVATCKWLHAQFKHQADTNHNLHNNCIHADNILKYRPRVKMTSHNYLQCKFHNFKNYNVAAQCNRTIYL